MSIVRGLRNAGVVMALVSLPSASALAQQGLGTIVGTVTDAATKKPIADVVVTATAPQLPGEQIVVTDSQGQFRIPQLPAGQYTLRFEKESYRPFSRSDIPLRIDTTVRVNTEILPDTAGSEDIVVVGKAPTIDIGSSQIGANVGADFVRNIAVARPTGRGGAARSFESLAEVAPGTNADEYGVSVAGTSSPENGFVVDGLSVNDPGFGLLGTPLSVEFVQEVNVITGGYMPEFGRSTGGTMNVVTKSGSNEFKGSVWTNYTPGTLQSQVKPTDRSTGYLTTSYNLWNSGDVGAELGGPIVKDKLWFYAGFNPSFDRRLGTRQFNTVQGTGANKTITPIDGAAERRFADQRSFQFLGKLTYAINQDNTINLSVYGAPNSSGGNGRLAFDAQSGNVRAGASGAWGGDYSAIGTAVSTNPIDVAFKMNNAFADKRVLLDTTLGWHNDTHMRLPYDGSRVGSNTGAAALPSLSLVAGPYNAADLYNPADSAEVYSRLQSACVGADGSNLCPVQTWTRGGMGNIAEENVNRLQGKSVATFLFNGLGSHTAKAGVDLEYLSYRMKAGWTGGRILRDYGGGFLMEIRNYAVARGPGQEDIDYLDFIDSTPQSYNVGAFLQDSWSVMDTFTLNLGVRYDSQTLIGGDGKLGLSLPNQISPRLGIIYDPTQQGRSKFYASYSRFYEMVPLNLGARSFGIERGVYAVRDPSVCDVNDPASTGPNGTCWDNTAITGGNWPYADPGQYGAYFSSHDRSVVDPNLKNQSTDEWTAGGEYQLFANSRVGAFYTKRYMNSVIEDMSRDEAATYFIGNPGEGIATDFPRARRDYDAVTVFFNKDFADLWLLQANYTWSRNFGNYAGLFRPETGQLNPNINSDFDLKSLLGNRTGFLPNDRTHNFKLFVAKEFVLGGATSFNVGASYRARSGTPYSALGAHELYGADEVFVLPRGSVGRLPWLHDIDMKLGFNQKLSATNVLTVGVDVFNVFNFQGITRVDERFTAQRVLPVTKEGVTVDDLRNDPSQVTRTRGGTLQTSHINPSFGQPTAFQTPRNVRFSARVTF